MIRLNVLTNPSLTTSDFIENPPKTTSNFFLSTIPPHQFFSYIHYYHSITSSDVKNYGCLPRLLPSSPTNTDQSSSCQSVFLSPITSSVSFLPRSASHPKAKDRIIKSKLHRNHMKHYQNSILKKQSTKNFS
ncbi:hypothetical protein SNEBB_000615 [Seison nebaliae]|nr:hypothetical protein SNEBB_000615 [Seison nebaliae]